MSSIWLLLLLLYHPLFIVVEALEKVSSNGDSEAGDANGAASAGPNEMPSLNIENGSHSFQFLEFDWDHVSTPYIAAFWILLASIAKIVFHKCKKICGIFPDCALMIMVGLVVGFILYELNFEYSSHSLDSKFFFLYLLSPIIFGAGYFMPNRTFFDNLGSIVLLTLVGVLWNTFAIGLSLWLVGRTGIFTVETPLLHVLLFSSLISATDPVAVISLFDEIHVNKLLFTTVFAESLLNDAISVVLYRLLKSFLPIGIENMRSADCAAGFLSFFVVALGGVLIGVIWAAIVGFMTRHSKDVDVVKPVFVFVLPYCAYLAAEMTGLSAIIALVVCGIAMKPYVKLNIPASTMNSIKYFIKVFAEISEAVIFLFLGLSAVRSHQWDFPFILLTIIFCVLFRTLGMIIPAYFLNKFRLVPYSKVDQFVLAYSGNRGPIAFGLVIGLPDSIPAKDLFITATIAMIYFSVILQGMTLKPLVKWLKIELDDPNQKSMMEHTLEKQLDFTMVGLEDICGYRGHHWLRSWFERFSARWLRPLLVDEASVRQQGSKLVREFTRVALLDAVDIAEGRKPNVSKSSSSLQRLCTQTAECEL
uniref:Sodium/hydrogen exchanger n=1 Tax=Plectus sambesii TaxID=2011161 RepID=A0A914VJ38_9BILA